MPGCTNHDCIIDPQKGVGTNGICHCLDGDVPLGKENARALKSRIRLMQRVIKAQQSMLEAYEAGVATRQGDWVAETMVQAKKAGLVS